MPERIALLGWGSLLWQGSFVSPEEEQRQQDFDAEREPWRDDGPILKIEFSRISSSRGGALTLVIDAENGAPVPVAWSLSRRSAVGEAIEDLRRREGTSRHHIGYYSRTDETHYRDAEALSAIRAWAAKRQLDAVVWTDLPSNFREIVGQPFSVAAAIDYLLSLKDNSKIKAFEYIRRAPDFVCTPLRNALSQIHDPMA